MLRRAAAPRYLFASGAAALALAIRFSLSSTLHLQFPFALSFCAVVLAAWFGGRGPGLVATVITSLGAWYLIFPPVFTFSGKADLPFFQLIVFVSVSALIALLAGSLRMANDVVRDREGQLRAMAAAMPGILFSADTNGRIEMLSEKFEEYTGETPPPAGPGWLALVHPSERSRISDAWNESIAQKADFLADCQLEGKDGKYRWFQCRAVPMPNSKKQIVRWLGVCADIDDHKRVEATLAAKTGALARANEELKWFAFGVSHDLQEPLRMVGIFSDLLIRDQPLSERSAYAAEQIKRGVERLNDLIKASLDYAVIGVNESQIPARTSLEQPLDDALWSLQEAIQQSSAVIHRQPLPDVIADPRMISRVFQNLISNAIRFRGAEPPVISVTAARDENFAVVSVSDNGIGITEGNSKKVFEPFLRLHAKNDYPGSGLGLASVKRIVESYGGAVWVQGVPGQGSTFFFTLPLAQPL